MENKNPDAFLVQGIYAGFVAWIRRNQKFGIFAQAVLQCRQTAFCNGCRAEMCAWQRFFSCKKIFFMKFGGILVREVGLLDILD